ncbi:MAG: hypothetical protein SGPRY_010883, partial [Prymnesium sp.]
DFLQLADSIFGKSSADRAENADAISKISAAHASGSWQPHKSGWQKSTNKAAERPLATGEYPKSRPEDGQ